jgi:hypothetical protein
MGVRSTAEHKTWCRMRSRVRGVMNPAAARNYRDRGITICARWESFQNFLDDMGPRPDGAWLDRIDNDGPYSPENCRWASPKQQQRNRRNNTRLTFNGETLCIAEWAERLSLNHKTISDRLRHGWSVGRALTATG